MGSVKHPPLALWSLQMLDQKKRKAFQKQLGMCLMTMGLSFSEGSAEESAQHARSSTLLFLLGYVELVLNILSS